MRRLIVLAVVFGLGIPLQRAPSFDDLAKASLATIDGTVTVDGLKAEVQVVRDRWGVPHIYADSTDDLFFAQGYVMAQDRLWQMELWRRTAEGRLAEVLGPSAIARDRQARLLKYRGPMTDAEFGSYHPQARQLFEAYARGVNAYIDAHRDRLPVEFVLTGIVPEHWTAEQIVLRPTTLADAAAELQLARSVAQLGRDEANRRRNPDPWDPLDVPRGLDVSIIGEEAIASTRIAPVPKPSLLPQFVAGGGNVPDGRVKDPGSNNWVVSGALSATGKPVIANDPHREVTNPSLRYIVHLSAPGFTAIGAGEPPFVGVAIGHNDSIGWGLTIVGTDQQDVYVEELNPANHDQVKWKEGWETLRTVREEIRVKGQAPEMFEMKSSRHGPIFHVDTAHNRAYAVRSALLEPGTAPYLASLRLAQVKNCREFLDAAMYWKCPTENLICGDVDGNISWQASALTPRRKGWVGRLPVPGTGDYEWDGFRTDLPRELNPARGFIMTANHNIQPQGYTPPLMFKNADTRFDRIRRLQQLIQPGRKYSLEDHQRMQHDAYSLRAAADAPLFKGWVAQDPRIESAREEIAAWDHVYSRDSRAAALYESWRSGGAGPRGRSTGSADVLTRAQVEERLRASIASLERSQGADRSQWRWGRMHTRAFPHPFVPAFDLPTVERAGGAGTVAADGATYREIMDTANWDRSVTSNVPGQSGQPGSPYYSNLLRDWAENVSFPMTYGRQAVAAAAAHRLVLKPADRMGEAVPIR